MTRKVLDDFVKTRHRIIEDRQIGRTVGAANRKSAGLAQDAVHVPDEFTGRADFWRRSKLGKLRRRFAKHLLRPVGQGGQKMLQQLPLFVHRAPFDRLRLSSQRNAYISC